MQAKTIKLSDLHLNTGQIKDVPKNPRFIKDERYEALKKSIQDDPEMLQLRELVAYDNNGKLVVILGNMRYRAMKELGFKDAPVKVLPPETDAKKLRAYIQKDNIAFGQNDWDLLGNEWDLQELQDFGLECEFMNNAEITDIDKGVDEEEIEDKISLSDRFIAPPLSIIDSRQGYWRKRKEMWRNVIGDKGESREDKINFSNEMKYADIYSRSQKEREKLKISFSEYLDK